VLFRSLKQTSVMPL